MKKAVVASAVVVALMRTHHTAAFSTALLRGGPLPTSRSSGRGLRLRVPPALCSLVGEAGLKVGEKVEILVKTVSFSRKVCIHVWIGIATIAYTPLL